MPLPLNEGQVCKSLPQLVDLLQAFCHCLGMHCQARLKDGIAWEGKPTKQSLYSEDCSMAFEAFPAP